MAPNKGSKNASANVSGIMNKLPPIPKGAKVQKRALLRRQLPASSKTRIIYVSSSTPFMSAVKRVRKQLDRALRETGTSSANPASGAKKGASLHDRVEALLKDGGSSGGAGTDSPSVTVMGTGRAVEKTLGVASWYEQQGDCAVSIRTKTVGTVDDVVLEDGDAEDETRVRKLSSLEVTITLK